jgi:hypothetical protein
MTFNSACNFTETVALEGGKKLPPSEFSVCGGGGSQLYVMAQAGHSQIAIAKRHLIRPEAAALSIRDRGRETNHS